MVQAPYSKQHSSLALTYIDTPKYLGVAPPGVEPHRGLVRGRGLESDAAAAEDGGRPLQPGQQLRGHAAAAVPRLRGQATHDEVPLLHTWLHCSTALPCRAPPAPCRPRTPPPPPPRWPRRSRQWRRRGRSTRPAPCPACRCSGAPWANSTQYSSVGGNGSVATYQA